MAASALLRRQIVVNTLLVAAFASIIALFNISRMSAGLVGDGHREVELVAQCTADSVQAALPAARNNPGILSTTSLADGLARMVQNSHGVVKRGRVVVMGNKTIISIPPTGADDSLGVAPDGPRGIVQWFQFLMLEKPANFGYSKDFYVDGQIFGQVQLEVSYSEARHQILRTLWFDLALVLFATFLAVVIGVTYERLIATPLQAITTSIEQIEQAQLQPPDSQPDRNRAGQIGMVAGRIEQIGKQIAGDRSELLEARGRLHQILTNLHERVLLVSAEGRVMLASPGVEELLGASGPAEGRMLEEFVGSDHPLVIMVRLALASGDASTHATLPGMNDDRSKPLSTTVQLILNRGETAGAFISLHDRETVAKLEKQLDYSERLADLARITAGIAHEVKNPLNAMVIHVELLREKLEQFAPGNTVALPQIDILTSEIRRLDRVVQTFLDFTKPPRMQLRPLDVNQILEESLALTEAEAMLHSAVVERLFSKSMPRIDGDPDLLKQAFLNIIINGFQAMTNGGILRVETSIDSDRNVLISISDQGAGIEPTAQARIFQLYYSTKPDGNGIGLAQAYKAVKLHNGSIFFQSELGIGTTFNISIPSN